MSPQPHLIARLAFADPFVPGLAPTADSFRAECDFGTPGMRNMVRIDLEALPLAPQDATAKIWLLEPKFQAERLSPGFSFVVYAGSQLVAHGKVETILDGALQSGA